MSAVFRVVENGAEKCFRTEHSLELLDAARLLRELMNGGAFQTWERISPEEFHRLTALRMENTGEVSGAFELDLDRGEFSAVHIMDGWRTFFVADVCAVADEAFREEGTDREEQWEWLLDGLRGKELTWADRISEESQRYTAFRVKEDGGEQFFQLEGAEDAMEVAKFLRWQLRQEQAAASSLKKGFPSLRSVTAEQYDRLLKRRMEVPRELGGAFELDFDAKRLSVVDAEYGWQSWTMADVTAALETACRKSGLAPDQYELRFWQALEGRQLLTPGHLSARELVLAEEISEVDGLLSFYMEVGFDADAVFGTHVCTAENDDWLNVYANYDMAAGEVCNELLLILHRGNGSEEELTYSLDAVEKAVLLRKMDEHCQFQAGQTLKELCAELKAEELELSDAPEM